MTFFFCTPLFVVLLFFSCKSRQSTKLLEHPEPEDPFLGLYVMDIPASRSGSSRKGIISYSVEFKADQTARVLLFKEGRTEPEISHGKWLIAKDGIIILYFEQNILSEFFIKNEDGSLSFLNAQRKPYSGELAELLILRKIEKK